MIVVQSLSTSLRIEPCLAGSLQAGREDLFHARWLHDGDSRQALVLGHIADRPEAAAQQVHQVRIDAVELRSHGLKPFDGVGFGHWARQEIFTGDGLDLDRVEPLQGVAQQLTLQHRLVEFTCRVRERDDRAASPYGGVAAVEHDGADNDVEVDSPVQRKVTDGSGVDPPRARFERVDDLHRANLGCAGHRAAREEGSHAGHGRFAVAQFADHRRDHLVDGRERLDRAEVRHCNRAGSANAVEIVADQVDDHQVLGLVLLARAELLLQRSIFGLVPSAGNGALDGLAAYQALLGNVHHAFRGATQHAECIEAQEGRIGRRVDGPQDLVGGERVLLVGPGPLVAEADLVGLAVRDFAQRPADAIEIGVPVVAHHPRLGLGSRSQSRRRRCRAPMPAGCPEAGSRPIRTNRARSASLPGSTRQTIQASSSWWS